nr:putative reverse transcriptase domain-containing protein [Tanacetum cinerariifolium]
MSEGDNDADDNGDDLSEDDADNEDGEESSDNIPLQKRARFTTPTSRYEIVESSVVAAARQIRPTLTIAESRRADVGEAQILGPELIQETTEKIIQIKHKMQAARDRQKSYADKKLEIIDREVKRLKRRCIPIIKVRWNSKRGPEFTWEREDQFK